MMPPIRETAMLAIFFTPPGQQLRPNARAGNGRQFEIARPPPTISAASSDRMRKWALARAHHPSK
jgi:hypothetical protein